jgi:hypothetical protein
MHHFGNKGDDGFVGGCGEAEGGWGKTQIFMLFHISYLIIIRPIIRPSTFARITVFLHSETTFSTILPLTV